MTVTDKDRGAKELLRRLAKRTTVRVGVIGSEAAKEHGEGATNVDVATFHEFGLGVPRRSFIADYVDENNTDIAEKIRKTGKLIIKRELTPEQAFGRLGLYIQGEIQQRIADGIAPPLSEMTIERKGSSTPLIDTGQLRSSITYEVDDG
jgi:hypothetical protein